MSSSIIMVDKQQVGEVTFRGCDAETEDVILDITFKARIQTLICKSVIRNVYPEPHNEVRILKERHGVNGAVVFTPLEVPDDPKTLTRNEASKLSSAIRVARNSQLTPA